MLVADGRYAEAAALYAELRAGTGAGISFLRAGEADARAMAGDKAGAAALLTGSDPTVAAARARLDPEARAASITAYVERPYDGATPAGVVRALAALHRGEILSPESSDFILQTLGRVKTGPMRLRGGLSPGWRAAHKTGTGQDFRGETFGLNDVGLVTAPDGRVYAVAVLAPQVPKGSPLRLRVFQNVSSTLVSHWRIEVAASGAGPDSDRAD
jgi:hypothetical protein